MKLNHFETAGITVACLLLMVWPVGLVFAAIAVNTPESKASWLWFFIRFYPVPVLVGLVLFLTLKYCCKQWHACTTLWLFNIATFAAGMGCFFEPLWRSKA